MDDGFYYTCGKSRNLRGLEGKVKVLVFIKRVPDTGIPLKIKAGRTDIDRDASLAYVTNPFDEYAVEEAIRLKEKIGNVETVAVSLGDEKSEDVLRNALALGIDRAVLLKCGNPEKIDSFVTARILADFARKEGFDLILTGREAVDRCDQQVPSFVAEFLGIPQATFVVGLEVNPPSIVARRETDEGMETLELTMPALVSCEKGLNEPRLPTLRGIMAARSKAIEEIAVECGLFGSELIELLPPPERKPGRILDMALPESVRELVRILKEKRIF